MFNIGGGEVLVVLLVAMVVLGPERLPKAARDIGRAIAEFRRLTSGVQSDLRDAMGAEEFRESLDGLRSVVDLKSSIRNELQGLTSSLTSAVTGTGSGESSQTEIPGQRQQMTVEAPSPPVPGVAVEAAARLETGTGRTTYIPPPDGMYNGDAVAASLGLTSVPFPSASCDDVHTATRAADTRPRLGVLDMYEN